MKEFAKYLGEELGKLGYKDMSKIASNFSYNSFTTSSEYLGEFNILLKNILNQNIVNDDIKLSIYNAIRAIDVALGN